MRRGIGLRGYAQQDPLNEFRREAFRLYEELRGLIRHGVASSIFRVTVQRQPPPDAGPRPGAAPPAAAALRDRAATGRARRPGGPGAPAGRGAGSAVLRGGGLPAAPAARNVRESLGDAPVAPSPAATGPAPARPAAAPGPATRPTGERIGRNDPCWCGSGQKYKKCHGK